MIINTPEVFLKGFNNRILNLINSTEILDNPETKKKLKLIFRKLTISEILFEKYIISVSGLQGVGKTTFLKQIYSIPDEFLPENIGRGEQLPILITESDVSEISLNVIQLKKVDSQYVTVKEKIEKEEFFKISKNPSPSDLILEMKVPNRIFHSENKSFLLLPGFEDIKNEREDLVYHSLISSATCLFLFNETGYADQSNKNILEEINTKFENAKPIFITTFSDTSKDENESLKGKLIKKFNLQNEEDRVISIGTGKYAGTDKDRMDDWLPELEQSLGKYSHTTSQFRKSQMKNLSYLLDDELGKILVTIEDVNYRKDIKEDYSYLKECKEPLKILDEGIKKIKRKYTTELDKHLENFTKKPLERIDENITDKKITEKILRRLTGPSFEDSVKFKKAIEDSWNNANDYDLREMHTVVLNNLLTKGFQFHKELETNLGEKDNLLGNFKQPAKTKYLVSEDTVSDINKLFAPDGKSLPFSINWENTLKTLPLLCVEVIRIAGINSPNYGFQQKQLPNKNVEIKEVSEGAEISESKTNFILPGVFAVLGIDSIDGNMDTLSALSSAIGVKSTIIATTLVTAAGLIGAGIVVKSIISQINKTDFEDAEMAKTIIYSLRDRYYAHNVNLFDQMMEELKEFVTNQLRKRYHFDKEIGRREYLIKTVADVKEDRYNLNQLLNKQIYL